LENFYSELSVYPNPTSGMIYFDIENSENFYLRIYDSNAKLVYDNYYTENYIDLSNFVSGTYILEISQNDKTYIKKIILF
ncbi:MAG: T9SS type A sorting domain-containing protein, partial [Bacteroidales bacterium]|nr:T9SS type A sorting domain-containing protein [Bacteroidales bacterium]